MTPTELLNRIETYGGTLILGGDKIRYRIPPEAADLVEEIRAQRDAVIEVLRRRQVGFRCDRCGAHFDTNVGIAKHQVNGCGEYSSAPPELVRTIPSCPACGSLRTVSGKVGGGHLRNLQEIEQSNRITRQQSLTGVLVARA